MTTEQREILKDVVEGATFSEEYGGYLITQIHFELFSNAPALIIKTRQITGDGRCEYEDTDAFRGDGSRISELSTTVALKSDAPTGSVNMTKV